MNTEIHYMYRDGGNWKNHHSIVFKGTLPDDVDIDDVLREHLTGDDNFIASQVGFEEVFSWSPDDFSTTEDHCWHEYEYAEVTDREPTDPRTIQEVIEAFRKAREEGWEVFDPNPLVTHAPELLAALKALLGQFKTLAPMSGLNASCYLAEEIRAERAIALAERK